MATGQCAELTSEIAVEPIRLWSKCLSPTAPTQIIAAERDASTSVRRRLTGDDLGLDLHRPIGGLDGVRRVADGQFCAGQPAFGVLGVGGLGVVRLDRVTRRSGMSRLTASSMAHSAARTAPRDPSTPTTIDGGVNDSAMCWDSPCGWHSYCADVSSAAWPLSGQKVLDWPANVIPRPRRSPVQPATRSMSTGCPACSKSRSVSSRVHGAVPGVSSIAAPAATTQPDRLGQRPAPGQADGDAGHHRVAGSDAAARRAPGSAETGARARRCDQQRAVGAERDQRCSCAQPRPIELARGRDLLGFGEQVATDTLAQLPHAGLEQEHPGVDVVEPAAGGVQDEQARRSPRRRWPPAGRSRAARRAAGCRWPPRSAADAAARRSCSRHSVCSARVSSRARQHEPVLPIGAAFVDGEALPRRSADADRDAPQGLRRSAAG